MRSLETVVLETEPLCSADSVRISLQSDAGRALLYVIVEGDDDYRIYSRYFDTAGKCVVLNSGERSSSGVVEKGAEHVLHIVSTTLATFPDFSGIIGIIDKDYTPYKDNYQKPANVFQTDFRDIEMQMILNRTVWSELAKNPSFEPSYLKVIPIVRAVGCYRVYNYLDNIGFNFNKEIRQNKLWDKDAKDFVPDWENVIRSDFFSYTGPNCPQPPEVTRYNEIVRVKSLGSAKDQDICRGHDLVRLLHWSSSISGIDEKLYRFYDFTCFKQSDLYSEIDSWARRVVPVINVWMLDSQ